MIRVKVSGDYTKALRYFKSLEQLQQHIDINKFGDMGVDALRAATPKRSGKTAESWRYNISSNGSGFAIEWINDNVNKGVNIAIIIQYGHGTHYGAYVQGVDYINPALQPVFDDIAKQIWKEVKRL